MKRILCVLIAFLLVFAMVPVGALAGEAGMEILAVKLVVDETETELVIEKGEVFEQPEEPLPLKEGAPFLGWYKVMPEEDLSDPEWYFGQTPYDFTIPVNEDIKLVAVFYEAQPEAEAVEPSIEVEEPETEETEPPVNTEEPEETEQSEEPVVEEIDPAGEDTPAPEAEEVIEELPVEEEPIEDTNSNQVTIRFVSNNIVFSTETINAGETITDPGPPTVPEGQYFNGWFEADADVPFDFSTPIQSDFRLYARFGDNQYMVYFHDIDGNVVHRIGTDAGSRIEKPGQDVMDNVKPPELGQRFVHWYEEGNPETEAFDFNQEINSNVMLWPYFAAQFKLTFDAKGGTLVDPVWVLPDETPAAPAQPERAGYSFAGWYLKDTDITYAFDSPVNSDLELYAQWTPKPAGVEYEVVYWYEKPNIAGDPGDPTDKDSGNVANNYMYFNSTKKVALAGTVFNFTEGDATIIPPYSTYKSADQNVEIRGNGTSVINVYFARKEYTLTFDIKDAANPTAITTMTIGGKDYYSNGEEKYSLSVKFQQDIEVDWPTEWRDNPKETEFKHPLTGYKFIGWRATDITSTNWATKRFTITADMLPADGDGYTLSARWSDSTSSKTVRYFAEVLPGETGEAVSVKVPTEGGLTEKKISFKEMTEMTQTVNSSGNMNAKSIAGLTNVAAVVPVTNTFYYLRNPYSLEFDLKGGSWQDPVENPTAVKYGESLSEYKPSANPTKENHVFLGWYNNAEYKGEAFNFDTATMPENSVKLYAKWEPTEFTVIFYDSTGADKKEVGKHGAAQGGYAQPPAKYQPGYHEEGKGFFKNWVYLVDGEYMVYPLDTAISRNLTLFADWTYEGLRVTYDTDGGTGGSAPTDNLKYRSGVSAVILPPVGTLTKGGKGFSSWQVNGEGQTYYPGSSIVVNGNITLVARYLDPTESASATYHSNYLDGPVPQTFRVPLDEDCRVADKAIFMRDGQEISHWTLTPIDTAPAFTPGATYPLDELGLENGQINLYAQWKIADKTVTFKAGTGGKLDGNTQDISYSTANGTSWAAFTSENNIPTPVPNKDYYFTGWNPEFPDDEALIEENLVFTAKFVRKTMWELFIGEDDKYIYDGSEKTAAYTTSLDSQGYVVTGGTFLYNGSSEKPINVGAYTVGLDETATSFIITRDGIDVTAEFATIPAWTTGKLTVTPKQLTVEASYPDIVYGDPVPTGWNIEITGLIGNDTFDETILAFETDYEQGDDVGEYDIAIPAKQDGTDYVDGNYLVKAGKAGEFEVLPKQLTVEASCDDITYGDPVPTWVIDGITGFVSDAEKVLLENGIKSELQLSTNYTQGDDVGVYDINVAAWADGNYKILAGKAGEFTVLPKIGEVTLIAYEEIYDGEYHLPQVLTQIPNATVQYSSNGVNWHTEADAVTNGIAVRNVKTTGDGKTTVYVKVTAPNYQEYTGQSTVKITPKTLTVDTKDIRIEKGKTLVASNYVVKNVTGLVGNDPRPTFTYATTYTTSSAAADYNITVKTCSDPNYTFSSTRVAGKVVVWAWVVEESGITHPTLDPALKYVYTPTLINIKPINDEQFPAIGDPSTVSLDTKYFVKQGENGSVKEMTCEISGNGNDRKLWYDPYGNSTAAYDIVWGDFYFWAEVRDANGALILRTDQEVRSIKSTFRAFGTTFPQSNTTQPVTLHVSQVYHQNGVQKIIYYAKGPGSANPVSVGEQVLNQRPGSLPAEIAYEFWLQNFMSIDPGEYTFWAEIYANGENQPFITNVTSKTIANPTYSGLPSWMNPGTTVASFCITGLDAMNGISSVYLFLREPGEDYRTVLPVQNYGGGTWGTTVDLNATFGRMISGNYEYFFVINPTYGSQFWIGERPTLQAIQPPTYAGMSSWMNPGTSIASFLITGVDCVNGISNVYLYLWDPNGNFRSIRADDYGSGTWGSAVDLVATFGGRIPGKYTYFFVINPKYGTQFWPAERPTLTYL